ncbi:glycosyltransferase family 2 protein [Tenacibaculum ovolyticum]|uniref:glycosyltransferase family 2 protein n=1 Tax=Tenacibaculum ovolyticum TaxID=104270 RepID=UPI0004283951|nr:glycosyltransferase family 2 protein [Tenacibaculum ovolyticum]
MISIILPVYNVEAFVEKSIKSILNQTFKNFELIIINDGSEDSSLEICEKFIIDKRVSIISQENGGLSKARNEGLKLVKYSYVTFIDSDDWVDDTYLEDLYSIIKKNDADIAICGYREIHKYKGTSDKIKEGANNGKVRCFSKQEALSLLFLNKRINNFSCCKLYRTELFKDITFPEGRYFEDIYTTYLLFDNSIKIVEIRKGLYNYVRHPGSITASFSNKKNIDFFIGTRNQLKYFESNRHLLTESKKSEKIFLKRFYLIKKKFILTKLKNELTFKNEEELNNVIFELLKKIPLLRTGFLLYIKCYFSIKQTDFFEKYYLKSKKSYKNKDIA